MSTTPETETQPTVPMVPIEIDLPTGRPATLAVPIDMTDSEWFALCAMLPRIRDKLRAQLTPAKPALVRANEMPPAPKHLRGRRS